MDTNCFVIGYGSIGQELVRKIRDYGWSVKYIAKSDGVYVIDSNFRSWSAGGWKSLNLKDISIAFIVIPASPGGKTSREYATFFARRDIKVVSCEKSLFAYYPTYLESFGFTASVGGGSHLLPFVKEQVRGRYDVTVHLILNATLNFIMSSRKRMKSSVADAVKLNLAEPGANDTLGIINREIEDTALKTCIVVNHCFLPWQSMLRESAMFRPDDISVSYLIDSDIVQLEREKRDYRYIVSFSRQEFSSSHIFGGFRFKTVNGWYVSAGFKKVDDDPQFARLIVSGVNNSAVVYSEGLEKPPCYIAGPGAGPEPTVATMMQDAKRLLGVY